MISVPGSALVSQLETHGETPRFENDKKTLRQCTHGWFLQRAGRAGEHQHLLAMIHVFFANLTRGSIEQRKSSSKRSHAGHAANFIRGSKRLDSNRNLQL